MRSWIFVCAVMAIAIASLVVALASHGTPTHVRTITRHVTVTNETIRSREVQECVDLANGVLTDVVDHESTVAPVMRQYSVCIAAIH